MWSRLVLTLCLTAALASVDTLPASLLPDGAVQSPLGSIDLGDPASNRWEPAVEGILARHGYEASFGQLFATVVPHLGALAPLVDFLVNITSTTFPELYEEIEGMSAVFQAKSYPEVTTELLVVVNWISEIGHLDLTELIGQVRLPGQLGSIARACTSLVVRTPDGTILHARNDDADAAHLMQNLTVDLTWRRNGTVAAYSTQFVPWVGVYTSVRPGVASLTEDARLQKLYPVGDWMALLRTTPGTGSSALVMREAMIGTALRPPPDDTFDGLLARLQAAPIAAPEYMVLAGVSDGAVIERNFTEGRTLRLGDAPLTPFQTLPWALIETNWDWDKPEPAVDPRRAKASELLAAMGQQAGATLGGLLGVLSTEGVGPPDASWANSTNGLLNVGTAFTVALVPANGTLRSYLRDSHKCCG